MIDICSVTLAMKNLCHLQKKANKDMSYHQRSRYYQIYLSRKNIESYTEYYSSIQSEEISSISTSSFGSDCIQATSGDVRSRLLYLNTFLSTVNILLSSSTFRPLNFAANGVSCGILQGIGLSLPPIRKVHSNVFSLRSDWTL